jgi:hypothetical protein
VCGSRQLQYRCTLTLAQTCKQYDLAVWKFQRIMMGYGALRIDLPEAGKSLSNLLARQEADVE